MWTTDRLRELVIKSRTQTNAEIAQEWGISQAWVRQRLIAARWLIDQGKLRVD